MEKNQPSNAFREVHAKSLAVRKTMRKSREEAFGKFQRRAEDEARREGFDRPATDELVTSKDDREQ
jgi:hypothetical protein